LGQPRRSEPAMKAAICPNLNHRRSNAPVRFCPRCGEAVNSAVAIKRCSELVHAQRRQNREDFCVDCGEQLIK
jgi:hypothetical protein